MSNTSKTRGRLMLITLAVIFLGPVIFATWLYFGGDSLQPAGRTNHGALLEPIVNLNDVVPESALHAHGSQWVLLYDNAGSCAEACAESLYTMRQSRLMLGREMDRVQRIFVHGETPPPAELIATEHEGLVTMQESSLSDALAAKLPAGAASGGYFLIDPLGNLVLYFPPEIDPADMVDDIKHLLRLSQIG